MRLNTIKPALGAKTKPKRLGRGMGSGLGKTCGRGHKGQKARAGGYHKVGFEGGQMPLQRRLPKFGFNSPIARFSTEVRLNDLARVTADIVDIKALIEANVVSPKIKKVKIILAGKLKGPVTLRGIHVTKGAREAILAAGGKVE